MAVTLNANTSTGFIATSDTSGVLQLQTGGTAAVTVDASQNVGIGTSAPATQLQIGSASGTGKALRLEATGTTEHSVEFASDASVYGKIGGGKSGSGIGDLRFYTYSGGSLPERMRIDSSGNVGIGTSSPAAKLHVDSTTSGQMARFNSTAANGGYITGYSSGTGVWDLGTAIQAFATGSSTDVGLTSRSGFLGFGTASIERMRIDSSGNLLVGKTTTSAGTAGFRIGAAGFFEAVAAGTNPGYINRLTNDGQLLAFAQDGTTEGNIAVSGTTVSYNGGHLSRWAQTTTAKDESLVKGTVLSNLDEMNVYTDAEGNTVDNEQLNKVKVSDVEGDANVAGVFVNWTHDDAHDVDEINMAMTGDMIIRIAQGTTVQRGDLLMSAGDGTAKPQGDDIVRSKTVAKVTSTHVTCTYADGSFCVPCVLMAC